MIQYGKQMLLSFNMHLEKLDGLLLSFTFFFTELFFFQTCPLTPRPVSVPLPHLSRQEAVITRSWETHDLQSAHSHCTWHFSQLYGFLLLMSSGLRREVGVSVWLCAVLQVRSGNHRIYLPVLVRSSPRSHCVLSSRRTFVQA